MDITQIRKHADHFIWIGSEALYVQHRGDTATIRIELPPAGPIPYVPRLHSLWEESGQRDFRQRLTQALGGRLRMRMGRILAAIPDDLTWIETRALQDYFLMSGSGAPDKRLFFCPQSVLLRPAQEPFLAVTWSCRWLSVGLVRNGSVSGRVHLDIARSGLEELVETIDSLCPTERVPVCYPEVEAAPLPAMPGTGIPLEQMLALTH